MRSERWALAALAGAHPELTTPEAQARLASHLADYAQLLAKVLKLAVYPRGHGACKAKRAVVAAGCHGCLSSHCLPRASVARAH